MPRLKSSLEKQGTGIREQRARTRAPKPVDIPDEIRKLIKERPARKTYGMFSDEEALAFSQTQIEAIAFNRNPEGGLGRLEHFKNWVFNTWVGLRESWQPFADRQISSLCREADVARIGNKVIRSTIWTGCGGVGKTYLSALYALCWWLVDPDHSIAILTSTTKDMLRRRAWQAIRTFTDTMVDMDTMTRLKMPQPVQESKTMIQAKLGDDLHAIFAMAVAHGETSTAVAKMSGLHAPRMLLIVDECDGTPDAIFRTIPNMLKTCRDFTFLGIANAKTHLDAHGRLCEPSAGWSSITVESDTWPTRPISEWGLPPGICEHFDGHRSPNVLLRRTAYPHIYTYEDYLLSISDPEKSKHIGYWAQDRGFWAGEGVANTIFTEGMLDRYGGYGFVEWTDEPVKLAFLDPAFGGDECVLVFGEVGPVAGGYRALQVTEKLTINPVGRDGAEAEYVIAKQAQEACEQRGVRPQHFGLDTNGTGRGTGSVISTEWDAAILKFDSCGAVSKGPVSADDPTPCNEAYDRAVTEHWFLARNLLQAGQLKGIYVEAAKQFCTREYDRIGKKYRLTTKSDSKKTLGRSPDDADAVVGLCRLAVEVAGLYPRSTARIVAASGPSIFLRDSPDTGSSPYSQPGGLSGLYRST